MLSDFSGLNNPFLYDLEKTKLKKILDTRAHDFAQFVSGLPLEKSSEEEKPLSLVNGMDNNDEACSTTSSSSSSMLRSSAGLRRRGSEALSLNTTTNLNSTLERCIYEGDAYEWDSFQVRGYRKDESGQQAIHVEYYKDMPDFVKATARKKSRHVHS